MLALGSALAIVFGFILAAMVEREKRGEGFFRTIFLYPLAISLIVTGLVWRWMFNPSLGIQNFLHELGWESANFNWLAKPDTAMYAIILASIWHGSGFYMALMLAGLKGINSEIWSAARLDGVSFWRVYFEIIIPMMKFTFLTCAILLSLGVVKAYDIVVAMTNGGPGTSTWTPAYFAINAYSTRSNIGFASAAAVIMLLITLAIFLPLVTLTGWQARRREALRHERHQHAAPLPLAGRGWGRGLSSPRKRRRIRGSSIAILVFLAMCAAFVAIPLYVVIVTSFKPVRGNHARKNLRAPRQLDFRALVEGVEHALHRARLRRHQARLLDVAQNPLPEPGAGDRHLLRHRLRAGALEHAAGRTLFSSSSSSAPSSPSRSS